MPKKANSSKPKSIIIGVKLILSIFVLFIALEFLTQLQ
jgi:hypothetical protein